MATGREKHVELPAGPNQPRRLLDVLSRIPNAGDAASPTRWLEGVTWRALVCRELTADTDEVCDPVDFDVDPHDLNDTDWCTWQVQPAFRLADAARADLLSAGIDEDEGAAMLVERYNTRMSAMFASELISGAASGGMSLSTVASEGGLTFGAAVALPLAMSRLETEIARRLQGAAGFIHLPPGLLAQAVSNYGLELSDGTWRTPAGNIVISDAGYVDAEEPTGESQSGTDEEWVYASGPVFFESTAPAVAPSGNTDIGANTWTAFVHGYGILVFDPCPVTAVLVDYDAG